MAGAIDPAHLELILKTIGVENVKECVKAYEDLAKSAESTAKPLDQAKESLESIERAERAATVAAKEATAGLNEEAIAAKNMAEIADEVQTPLARLTGEGDGEEAIGGFKGMAGGAIKAEKAINSLMSGKALGRLGPMLESLLGPLGVPGLGLAFGAIAMEAEPAIRAVSGFIDAWDKGIKPLTDAAEAIERLSLARGGDRRARAYKRLEAQMEPLEEKKDLGILSAAETLQLRKLHEAAAGYESEAREEAAAADRHKREQAGDRFDRQMVKSEEDRVARENAKDAQDEANAQIKAMKKENRDDEFDRRMVKSEEDRVARENSKEAQNEAREQLRRGPRESRQHKDSREAQMAHGVREMAPGLEQQGFDVQGIAREALRQLPATGGNAAVAIQQAILAAYQRGLRMQQEDMARMQMFSEMMQGSR